MFVSSSFGSESKYLGRAKWRAPNEVLVSHGVGCPVTIGTQKSQGRLVICPNRSSCSWGLFVFIG